MKKPFSVPLTGCHGGQVLWIQSDDPRASYTEGDQRAGMARELASALCTVEKISDDGTALMHAALSAIDTLLGDAMELYAYAHDMQAKPERSD